MLDRVARQFAVEVLALPGICVHARLELAKAQEAATAKAQAATTSDQSLTTSTTSKSVFAQFKKYPAKTTTTTKTKTNTKSTGAIVTVEKANIFRFAGKLADALTQQQQQQQQSTVEPLEMDYATFKRMMHDKKTV